MNEPAEVKTGRRRFTPSGNRLIVAVGVASCAGLLFSLTRPVLPSPPVLAFEPSLIAEVEREDRERLTGAESEPAGAAAEVWRLYHAAGEAEVAPEGREAFEARQRAMADAVEALRDAEGAEALATLRSRALAELEAALAGDIENEAPALGSFPATTEAYGVFRDGEPVAPPFVVRTLFAARFNGIVGLELTADMSEVERKAYFGWLAVEAPEPPSALLTRAMEELEAVAPDLTVEVRAYRAFAEGHGAEAAVLYARLPTLRGRNAALGAQSSGM